MITVDDLKLIIADQAISLFALQRDLANAIVERDTAKRKEEAAVKTQDEKTGGRDGRS